MHTKEEIENIIDKTQDLLAEEFKKYDKIRDYNQEKVLDAFINNKIGEEHFSYVFSFFNLLIIVDFVQLVQGWNAYKIFRIIFFNLF